MAPGWVMCAGAIERRGCGAGNCAEDLLRTVLRTFGRPGLVRGSDCGEDRGRQFADEAWHESFKRKFIGLAELPDGSMAGISTTTLSVAEFSDYVDRIRQYAVQHFGIEI